jgi:signal transduction histidine kinase
MYSATRFRYAPRGTEVLLTCELTSDLQYVTVEVSDSGPGVAESMLDDIFKPFYRTDPGRDSNSGGTGLGLVSEPRPCVYTAASSRREIGGVVACR